MEIERKARTRLKLCGFDDLQIHYYIECCILQGLTLDETTVALQHLGVQERLTRISTLMPAVAYELMNSVPQAPT